MRTARMWTFVLSAHLALTACGGGSGDPVSVEVADPGVLVQGRVIGLSGLPTAEMLVAVLGHEPVVTDADGGFTTDGVAVPYSVAVFPDGPSASATVFVGLARLDSTLQLRGTGSGVLLDAEVSGTVVGGAGFPEPANHTTRVHQNLVDADLSAGASFALATSATGDFGPLPLSWKGRTTIEVIYRALQTQTDAVTGLPVTYTGYGTRTSQVGAGDTLLNQDVTLAPVGTDLIAGTASVAPGYEFSIFSLSLEYPSHHHNQVFREISPAPVFTYWAPVVPGTTLTLSGTATSLNGFRNTIVTVRGVAPGTTAIQLDIPAAPIGTFPPNGANSVDTGSAFHADDVPDRVYEFVFFGGGGPQFRVFTDQPVASIPDLTAYGLSLPPLASYAWSVATRGPFQDIDEATGPTGVQPPGLPVQTSSGTRTFTTAP